MRKTLLALLAVVALSIGVVWAEGKSDPKHKACAEESSCCCCAKSCPK